MGPQAESSNSTTRFDPRFKRWESSISAGGTISSNQNQNFALDLRSGVGDL